MHLVFKTPTLIVFSILLNLLTISNTFALSCSGDCRTVQDDNGCAIYAQGSCVVDNAGVCLVIGNLTSRSHFIPAKPGKNDWPNFLSKASRDRFKFSDCPVPVQPSPPVAPTPPTTPPPTPPVTPPPPTEPDQCNGAGLCECITNRGGAVDSENCGVNISKAACQAMVGQNNVTRVVYGCSTPPPPNSCTDPTKTAHCECYFLYEQPSAFESIAVGTLTKAACQNMVGKGGSKKYYKCEWDGECGMTTFGCEPWLPGCQSGTPSPAATCWWDAQYTAPVMAPSSVGPVYECNGPQTCTPSTVGIKKFCGPGMGDIQAQKGNITCRCN